MNKQNAFSLLELLIALALGSVLSLMIFEVFQLQKESVSRIQAMNETQSKIQFAHKVFSDSIRLSGFFGGLSADSIEHDYRPLSSFPGRCDTAWVFDLSNSLGGAEGGMSVSHVSGLPEGCLPDEYVAFSDVLWLKYASPLDLFDDAELDNKVNSKRYFLRSNASVKGVLFDGNNADKAQLTLRAEVSVKNRKMYVALFFLSVCKGEDCQHKGNSLKQYILMGNRFISRELMTGVDQMQFEYGLDTDNSGLVDSYMPASEINGNWHLVRSVKIYLLVREQRPEPGYLGKSHVLGEVASGNYQFDPEGKEISYRRHLLEFEVFRRNGLLGSVR